MINSVNSVYDRCRAEKSTKISKVHISGGAVDGSINCVKDLSTDASVGVSNTFHHSSLNQIGPLNFQKSQTKSN